ncbi:MAG: GWxTD domain-containing protein [Acidobacteriota bacterium]
MKKMKTIFFGLCIAFSFLHTHLAQEKSENGGFKRWIEGPIRYIITSKEEKAFKKLKTDTQRAYFIYRFWYKRDATPGTVRNEFREVFWDRVLTANAMFNETSKPGWKTDRGKIFILLGPPDIIESDTHPDVPFPPPLVGSEGKDTTLSDATILMTGQSATAVSDSRQLRVDTGFRGIERWTYLQSRSKNLPPHLIVAFYRSSSNEYILSDNPQHYTYLFPGLAARPDSSAFFIFQRDSIMATNPRADIQFSRYVDYTPPFSFENSIAFKLDLGEALEAPTVEELIDEAVTTSEFFNTIQGTFATLFFMNAAKETYVILQCTVPKKEILAEGGREPAFVSIFGRIESKEDRETHYSFASDAIVPGNIIDDGENLILLSRVMIPPGDYRAKIGILNLPHGSAGNFEIEIQVPDIPVERPALSSLVLTSSMEYHDDPGSKFARNILIKPKASFEFSRNEEFGVYFVVYNVFGDPESSLPDFTITYRFCRKEGEHCRAIGMPIQKKNLKYEIQGWTFPLKDWPQGDFILEVEVVDNISGGSASKSVFFSVK